MDSVNNIFEPSMMSTPKADDQRIVQKRWATSNSYNDSQGPSTSKRPHTGKNEVLNLLTNICQELNAVEERMGSMEARIMNIEKMLAANVVERSDMLAQNHLIRECKVMLKKVQQSVSYMTGEKEDENLYEITCALPLKTVESAIQMEAKIDKGEYRQAMITYIYKLKGSSGSLNDVIRKLFTDEFLQCYNWDGRCERKSLAEMKLVDEILFDVFKSEGRLPIEKSVKKSIDLAHNRLKQKIRLVEQKQK